MWFYVCGIVLAFYAINKLLSKRKKEKMLEKWTERSKHGKVILHGMYGNSKFLPTVSPFVLKLETYLRFAKIPYEIDKIDFWGPKGKTPWISYNGEHIADSQFIIEKLSKIFCPEKSTPRDKNRSVALMARLVVEEHLYWTGVMWRFAFGGQETFEKVRNGETSIFFWLLFKFAIAPQMRSMAWSQGVGRHSEVEVISLMLQDLRAISTFLGEKKFLLGDEPCEKDCAVFAGLASAVFMPDSPVKDELNGELQNLKAYCLRMKEKYWPDWSDTINKLKTK